MVKLNERGFIPAVLALLVMMAGIGAGTYVVQHPQILKSRAIGLNNSNQRVYEANNKLWLENDHIKVGFDLNWGGSLTDFVSSGIEIVNRHDTGREVQIALYDSNEYACSGCTGVDGWNPVQGGDKYNHGSPVIARSSANNIAYIKSQPIEWTPDNKGAGSTVPTDVYIEQWASFVADHPNTIKLHYKITNFGNYDHGRTTQEFPAIYLNKEFDRVVYYDGALKTRQLRDIPHFSLFYAPETWSSLINNNGFGLTVFIPGMLPYFYGESFNGDSGPTGFGTNYLAPATTFTFTSGRALEGDVYLIADEYTSARQVVSDIKNNIPFAHPFDPTGALDSPSRGQTVSNSIDVAGWVIDILPVSKVQIYIDSTLEGEATYGRSRSDILSHYPNAEANAGFSYSLDTTKYANGSHTISVVTTTTDGKTAALINKTPITITNSVRRARGTLDSVSCTVIEGWACDPTNANQPMSVHLYKGPYNASNTSNNLGNVVANQSREAAVGAQCGGVSTHGFRFIPTSGSIHAGDQIYAYEITSDGSNPLLNQSPKVASCTVATPPPSPTPTPPPSTGITPSPAPTFIPGDINQDHVVNQTDADLLTAHFGQTGTSLIWDLNGNGRVDIFDYNLLLQNYGRTN